MLSAGEASRSARVMIRNAQHDVPSGLLIGEPAGFSNRNTERDQRTPIRISIVS
jgi:hypothetical protein